MEKENKVLIITIILLIVFSLSATYAYLTLEDSATTENTAAGCFNVNYSGQEINAASLTSTIEDLIETEAATSVITLSKATDCKIYTEASIAINTNSTTTAPISDGALKYKIEVTSGDGKIYNESGTTPSLTVKTGSITTIGETVLADVSLTNTATTYKIYLWIDSEISGGNYHGKSYSGYLYSNAIQSSDITQ